MQGVEAAAGGGRAEVARVVEEVIASILPGLHPGGIPHDRHVKELGADSVDRVEILLGILDRLGLDEPMASFAGLPDVAALIDLLSARRGA